MTRLPQKYVHLLDAFLRDLHPGWRVDALHGETCVRVNVHRGLGRDIEFGTSTVSMRELDAADGISGIMELIAKTAEEARRQAEHHAWVKTKGNNVIGIAGKWRKWAA